MKTYKSDLEITETKKDTRFAIKLENDLFRIRINYFGDYEKDFKRNALKPDNLFITTNTSIEESYVSIDVFIHAGLIKEAYMVNIKETTFLFDELDELINEINCAKETLIQTKSIIKKYFPDFIENN